MADWAQNTNQLTPTYSKPFTVPKTSTPYRNKLLTVREHLQNHGQLNNKSTEFSPILHRFNFLRFENVFEKPQKIWHKLICYKFLNEVGHSQNVQKITMWPKTNVSNGYCRHDLSSTPCSVVSWAFTQVSATRDLRHGRDPK